jgi:hypothetical protein
LSVSRVWRPGVERLVSAFIDLDFDGYVTGYNAASAEWLNPRRVDQLEKRLRPAATDEQAKAEMRAAAPRFGPEAGKEVAAAATALLPQLEPFIGKAVVTATNLDLRVSALWRVMVDTRYASGAAAKYNLMFEPFEGKLAAIGRYSP